MIVAAGGDMASTAYSALPDSSSLALRRDLAAYIASSARRRTVSASMSGVARTTPTPTPTLTPTLRRLA
jgi:hypothetical protein